MFGLTNAQTAALIGIAVSVVIAVARVFGVAVPVVPF